MSRRLAASVATVLVSAVALAPAHAATAAKKAPRTTTTTHTVTLLPDPALEATGEVSDGCLAAAPVSVDNHPLSVPAAGKLHVTLDAPDPAGSSATDWDLWILDSDGSILDGSHGATSHEETVDAFKKATKVTIRVCNLAGAPSGTVKAVFTRK